MQNPAPIALFVYKRIENTKQLIESLLKNDLAKDSDIFIFSDSAKNEKDYKEVEKVRGYLRQISRFKKIEIT